jgi:hypothetical protein
MNASEQGICFSWAEEGQQAGTGIRAVEMVGSTIHGGEHFGTRRQAMMASIAWRNLRSILESVCIVIGTRHPGGTGNCSTCK